MKRTKFIAGALVLSIGLLGTGYAYWTDALQVNTTVSTGNFDVNYTTETTATVAEGVGYVEFDEPISDKSADGNDSILFNVSNLYPTEGTAGTWKIVIKNDGSIGVKLSQLILHEEGFDENIKFSVNESDEVGIEGLGKALSDVINPGGEENPEILEPEEEITLEINVRLEPLSTGDINKTQDLVNQRFAVSMEWTQFNGTETTPLPESNLPQ